MSRTISILAIFTVITLTVISCYYDNEEALYPSLNSSCDTTSVTFSGQIEPMLANNCLSCHSNTAAAVAGNGIKLENYEDVKLILPAIAGSIKHTGSYSPMPKNGGMLKPCLISQFDIWVRNGALNN